MPWWQKLRGDVESRDCIVTFDGGAAGAQGTGGFLVWGRRAQLWKVAAVWYGSKATTNNVAEGYALLDALEWLATMDVDRRLTVLVLGDSQLMVDFAMHQAKPKV